MKEEEEGEDFGKTSKSTDPVLFLEKSLGEGWWWW